MIRIWRIKILYADKQQINLRVTYSEIFCIYPVANGQILIISMARFSRCDSFFSVVIRNSVIMLMEIITVIK